MQETAGWENAWIGRAGETGRVDVGLKGLGESTYEWTLRPAVDTLRSMNNTAIDDMRAAARELIGRYGDLAIDIAKGRAKQFELAADWPAHSIAMQVLTEVERLAGEVR